MERDGPLRQCSLCGKYMKFEGAVDLAGTGKASLSDPPPNLSVELFCCECGRIESCEPNTIQQRPLSDMIPEAYPRTWGDVGRPTAGSKCRCLIAPAGACASTV